MKRDLLRGCVDALNALRAQMHKELDASVAAELDAVKSQLEHCMKDADEEARVGAELRVRALEVLARCLNAATNLAEIVRRYFGPE